MKTIYMQQTINYLATLAQQSENPQENMTQLNELIKSGTPKQLESDAYLVIQDEIESEMD